MDTETLPLAVQVDLWRQKAIAGTLSDDEMKLAVRAMRANRVSAVVNSPKAKAADNKKAADAAASDILGELGL